MPGDARDDFESLARRYWAAWGELMQGTGPAGGPVHGAGAAFAPPPGLDAWQASMDWWSRLARGGAGGADEAVARFNGQASDWYARMQDLAARFSGRDGSTAEVVQAWKDAMANTGGAAFPDMLRGLQAPGLQGVDAWIGGMQPWLQSLQASATTWLGMPAFGAGREHQERWQALAGDMLAYQEASAAYARLMARVQQEALERFEARLVEREEPGRQVQSTRALFDLWIDAAEEAYAEVALSREFREVYGRLVNAQMRVRAGVQRLVEEAGAQFGMPTRSEVDGAHRKLTRLEREVRRLRDALQAREPAAPGEPAPRARAAGAAATGGDAPPAPPGGNQAAEVGKPAKAAKATKSAKAKGHAKPGAGAAEKGPGHQAAAPRGANGPGRR